MELMLTENYYIKINCSDSNELIVELSDVFTGDSWKGVFEPNYIEELTRKTGNFKSFHIFVNMLKTALNKASNTVTLEVLTYSDLEALRSRKSNHNQNTSSQINMVNTNKRYLIMTYNVEFDSINYPLQLNHQGKVDSHILINMIRSLRDQVKTYEAQLGLKNHQQDSNDDVEDIQLISKFNNNKVKKNPMPVESFNAPHFHHDSDNQNQQQQIKLLKQIVKTIEEKSLKEKNVLQKQLSKKRQECEVLKQELAEMKITERGLRNELRQMTNEVRMLKQNRSIRQSPIGFKRSSSTESLSRIVGRSSSRSGFDELYTGNSARSRRSSQNNNMNHEASNSRASSRNSSLNRRAQSPSSVTSTSSNARSKFNPTEYINSRKTKLQENELRKKREIKNRLNTSNGSRHSLTGSNLSLAESEGGFSYISIESQPRSLASQKTGKRQTKTGTKPKTLVDDLVNQTSDEMKEIDEKLKSLQMLIKNAAF